MFYAMTADRHMTPEKQLLNLIENPPGQAGMRVRALKKQGVGFFSKGALHGRLAFFRKHFAGRKVFQLDVRMINALLLGSSVLVAVYFAVSSFFSYSDIERKLGAWDTVVPVDPSSAQKAVSSLKELDYYLDKVQERDIFQIGPRRKVVKAAEVGPQSAGLTEATKDLRLVGISWSDNPDVMIEDVNRKMTFFLKRGQELEGGVVIRDVFKDKVILEYNGEEMELQ